MLLVVEDELEDESHVGHLGDIVLGCAEKDRVQGNGTLVESPLVFCVRLPIGFDLDSICKVLFLQAIENADPDGTLLDVSPVELGALGRERNALGLDKGDLAAVLVGDRTDLGAICSSLHLVG